MQLYRVTAADYDYDEYDAFLIWAKTPEQALEIAQKGTANFDTGARVILETEPDKPGVALSSFNAG